MPKLLGQFTGNKKYKLPLGIFPKGITKILALLNFHIAQACASESMYACLRKIPYFDYLTLKAE